MALDVEDALSGRGWDGKSRGLHLGERVLMEWYAVEEKFFSKDWDKQAKTFFGGEASKTQ
jgi:hypothetical protein